MPQRYAFRKYSMEIKEQATGDIDSFCSVCRKARQNLPSEVSTVDRVKGSTIHFQITSRFSMTESIEQSHQQARHYCNLKIMSLR